MSARHPVYIGYLQLEAWAAAVEPGTTWKGGDTCPKCGAAHYTRHRPRCPWAAFKTYGEVDS